MTRIVAITGKRGHGKTTAARVLEENQFAHYNFADPLREAARVVYGLTDEEMNDPVLKEQPIKRWPFRSPREILQKMGTEMFRGYLPETWTRAFERRCEGMRDVVCSDLRFLNEEKALRDMGAILIRVTDPRKPANDNDIHGKHVSEMEMDAIVVDHEIINDGTIEELQAKVREAVYANA